MVSVADIQLAAERLNGVAATTPLLESLSLNASLGARLLVKAECLQHTGSFKFRGAYNRLSQLDPAGRVNGVVAYSSGNHAQGVAAAAQLLGVAAAIVMPADAPSAKIEKTRAFGAEVILYDRLTEDRAAIATRLATQRGATLVPPYDDPAIIAGQGTAGLEMARQCAEMNVTPDAAIIPASGGGLAAGCGIALSASYPSISLHVAEPESCDDTGRSLRANSVVANEGAPGTICDALQAASPGKLTWPILSRSFTSGVGVTDAAVMRAMAVAWAEFKLVLEPGGAIALAAVLDRIIAVEGSTVLVVASGGNADRALFRRALDVPANEIEEV